VGLVADPDFVPDLLDEIDQMMEVVNLAAKVQALVVEGYSDLWVRNPLTDRSKRIWILHLPN